MSTARLYYDDPSLREFDATVVRVGTHGGNAAVWLDRTAFYPTSGGQPHDTGRLGTASVVNVEEDEHGDIVHVTDGEPPAAGTPVHGTIDWARRFDHMQQHTGQHLLSAVLEHAFHARTVSFHLGAVSSTIDIDRELSADRIARAELETNQAVWSDLPVSILYASEDEARQLPLRKESARTGTLRLIGIGGIDLSACGGTHVGSSGAIGQIAIASWERFKGGQRIEFLCGARALARFQQLRDTSAACIRLLSVLPPELPGAIERLQGELKDQKKALATAQVALAHHEAAALARDAEPFASGRLVLRSVDGDAGSLRVLAAAIAAHPQTLAVLVSRTSPVQAVAAGAPGGTVSCQTLVQVLLAKFGGRGGGKPDLAQCGGLQAEPEAVLAAVREWLEPPNHHGTQTNS